MNILELFAMFNVEVDTAARRKGYFNIVRPLWVIRKIPQRQEKFRKMRNDNLRPGISAGAPGSPQRIADLAAYYAAQNDEISPFES